jgi:large subunit ribosomal protein L3
VLLNVTVGVGQATHGQHNRLRAPGSVGASSYPSEVFKECVWLTNGRNVKRSNLRVLKVVAERTYLLLRDVFLM